MFTRLLKIALSQPVAGGRKFTVLAHKARMIGIIPEKIQKWRKRKSNSEKSEYLKSGWNPCDACRCKNKV